MIHRDLWQWHATLKKITSFLSFSFAASPAGRDFPHADDALLRPPPRVAERREVLLNKSKTFKKKCMFKIYKLFRSYMVTVQKLLRHCVKLGVASRLPQISPEALTLCCFFFLFLRLAVWTLLCSSIISKAQRMTFHQRGTWSRTVALL